MSTEKRLSDETKKWKERLEEELPKTTAATPKGEEFLANIRAYLSDSGHFEEKNDRVRAFEAIVWSWAWLEIGRDLKLLKANSKNKAVKT